MGDPSGKMLYATFLQKVKILVNDGSPASYKGSSRVALSFLFQLFGFAGRSFFLIISTSTSTWFWRSHLLSGIRNYLQRHLTMMDSRPFCTQVLVNCGEFTEDIHLSQCKLEVSEKDNPKHGSFGIRRHALPCLP